MKRRILKYILLLMMPLAGIAREVPDSIVVEMQRSKEFKYANDPAFWARKPPPDNSALVKLFEFFATSPIIRVLAYAIVALILGIVIYQIIAVNKFSVFSRSRNKKSGIGEETADLSAEALEQLANEAITSGQYRKAIRYLFLQTLKVLNDKQLIQLHIQSTNQDYLSQMRQSRSYSQFATLTRIYEYVWYGEFEPGREQFEKIHQSFKQFISAA